VWIFFAFFVFNVINAPTLLEKLGALCMSFADKRRQKLVGEF